MAPAHGCRCERMRMAAMLSEVNVTLLALRIESCSRECRARLRGRERTAARHRIDDDRNHARASRFSLVKSERRGRGRRRVCQLHGV